MQAAPMRKYLLVFTGAYLAALGVIFVIRLFTDLGGGGLSAGVLIAAIGFAAHRFARDHGRVPNSAERLQFALGALLISFAIGLLIMLVVSALLPEGMAGLDAARTALRNAPGAFVFAMVLFSALQFAAAYYLFRWIASSTLKQAKRKAGEQDDGRREPTF